MIQAAIIELHRSLQALEEIPGALSDGARATCDHSLQSTAPNSHHQQIHEHAHRRALRRIERALVSLVDTGIGDDTIEITHQHQDNSSSMIWLDKEEGRPNKADDLQQVGNDNINSLPSENEVQEVLKNDLVAVLSGLGLPDDEMKRELAESCISAAAQAIVSFNYMLSGDNIVAILSRLLLTGVANNKVQAYLLWVLNRQFEEGVWISSKSVAVLASFEILELVTSEYSADCLVEELESIERGWYTCAAYMITFSMPNKDSYTSPEDLRLWLEERIAEGAINGTIEDLATRWMSNARQFVLSIANFALDALDTNDKHQAIYHVTLTCRILACFNTEFDSELQSTVTRLWMSLVHANLKETCDVMDHELQYSISSLSLKLYSVIQDWDETTTIVMFMRALEFPELIIGQSQIFMAIPKRILQCAVLTLLRQPSLEQILIEQLLERLVKCDGDLTDAFFWHQVSILVPRSMRETMENSCP